MLVLHKTTHTLEAQAGSDPGANVPVHVVFEEQIDGQQLQGKGSNNPQIQNSQMATGGTTSVTILSAPSSGYRRQVKFIGIKNTGAGSVAYTLRFVGSAESPTTVNFITITLLTGEMLHYQEGLGWYCLNTAGHMK